MTKSFSWFAAILLMSFTAFAQNPKAEKPNFDTTDFAKKAEVAEWLVQYDEVAWKTSDLAMAEDKAEVAKLGSEWFCFQDDKKMWHAIYGKFANNKYVPVFHYNVDAAGKITRTSEKINQEFLNAHAQALVVARAALRDKVGTRAPAFNQYIRRNIDRTFDVWMLPAFQADGTAIVGGEGIYRIDSTGRKIITDSSYFQKDFRGFKTQPPREIWLDYREIEKPTLGSIFFVLYYRSYFTDIFIDNSKSTSSIVKDEKGGYIWVNVEKDDKKKLN